MPGAAPLRIDSDGQRTYTIGELADEFGLTLRTIRHYEDEGLLAPARDGMSRVYGHRDRARLVLICRGKRLGFSLAEIKEFLTLYDDSDGQVRQMQHLQALTRRRVSALERQLADVQQTLAELYRVDAQITEHLTQNLRRHGIDETSTREDKNP
ncbi:MAG TPA: MerR family DNA-binding transcriptional regulator [Azospirillum sp.]|nr:MerR family DNA-binding transcriptional regulator [Azospirillum sp.]